MVLSLICRRLTLLFCKIGEGVCHSPMCSSVMCNRTRTWDSGDSLPFETRGEPLSRRRDCRRGELRGRGELERGREAGLGEGSRVAELRSVAEAVGEYMRGEASLGELVCGVYRWGEGARRRHRVSGRLALGELGRQRVTTDSGDSLSSSIVTF